MPPQKTRKTKAPTPRVRLDYADGTHKMIRDVPAEPESTNNDLIKEKRRSTEYRREVTKALTVELARSDAKKLASEFHESQEKVPDFASHEQSFYDEIQKPARERRYAVDKLAQEGQIVSMPSPRKTGKTTFLANLGFAGLTGSDFLDSFATDLQGDEGLAVINAEMLSEDYRDVWEALNPGELDGSFPYQRLRMMHCRETGTKINLLSDRARSAFVDWLIDQNARWLFLDPWKEFVTWAHADPNSDRDINELLDAVKDVSTAAGLLLTVIPAHTPQSGEAGIRTKGAGAFEDGVDAIWKYWRIKDERSAPRLFAAQGRVEGIDPVEVVFDREHYALSLGSRSGREIIAEERQMARDLKDIRPVKASPTQDAIWDVLDHPMSPVQIAEVSGMDHGKVKTALSRGKGTRFLSVGDGTWKRMG